MTALFINEQVAPALLALVICHGMVEMYYS